MRIFFPIPEDGNLCILNTWTSPLLHKEPKVHFGVRHTERGYALDGDPPYLLKGKKIWDNAQWLYSHGREAHYILSRRGIQGAPIALSHEDTLRVLSREDENLPHLLILEYGRPPLEIQDPKLILAFHLAGDLAAPLDFSQKEKELLGEFIRAQPMTLALVHPFDLSSFSDYQESASPLRFPEREGRERGPSGSYQDYPGRRSGPFGRKAYWDSKDTHSGYKERGRFREESHPYPGWKLFLEKTSSPRTERVIALPEDGDFVPFVSQMFGFFPFEAKPKREEAKGDDSQLREGGDAPLKVLDIKEPLSANEAKEAKEANEAKETFSLSPSWRRALGTIFPDSVSVLQERDITPNAFWRDFFLREIQPGTLMHRAMIERRALFFEKARHGHFLVTGPVGTGKSGLGLIFLLRGLLNAYDDRKSPYKNVCYIAPSRAQALEGARCFLDLANILGCAINSQKIHVIRPESKELPKGDIGALFVSYEDSLGLLMDAGYLDSLGAVVVDELLKVTDPKGGSSLDLLLSGLIMEGWLRRKERLRPLKIMALSHEALEREKAFVGILSHRDSPLGSPVIKPLELRPEKPQSPQHSVLFQASYAKARFRAVSLHDLSRKSIMPQDFLLDNSRGSNFKNIAIGWVPGHRKIVYSSPAAAVLYGFSKFVMELGRTEVESIKESSFTERLLMAFEKEPVSDADREYYLRLFQRGVFFHYANLGTLTKALMLKAFRVLSPEKNEPFVLMADGTLAFGLRLPASAMFLDAIFWPKEHLDGSVSMELCERSFILNYMGRLTAEDPGSKSLVFINWPIWRGFENSDRHHFELRKNRLTSLFSQEQPPFINIELLGYLDFSRQILSLHDYPLSLQELFLTGLNQALKLKKSKEVKISEIVEQLLNGYSVRSFVEKDRPANISDLSNRINSYFTELSEPFPGMVPIIKKPRTGAKKISMRFKSDDGVTLMLKHKVDPASLLTLASFLEAFPPDSIWQESEHFGLMVLLMVPLIKCLERYLPRVFHLPTILREHELAVARTEPVEAHIFFRERSGAFTTLLEESGVNSVSTREMALRIMSNANQVVRESMRKHNRSKDDGKVFTTVRDAVLEYIFPQEERLLRWFLGHDLAQIQEDMCPRDSEIGEKRVDFTFDCLYRKRTFGVIECFIWVLESQPWYPEENIESLRKVHATLKERLENELMPTDLKSLEDYL
ncbi:MAG: hypothetical protein LBE27_04735 [Deltaproteobacteria bacterium]|jgi:hypothetical protein|nr:hypothetical protein [Deltaproteobacteria bacterium]